jgi:hypothetical protein
MNITVSQTQDNGGAYAFDTREQAEGLMSYLGGIVDRDCFDAIKPTLWVRTMFANDIDSGWIVELEWPGKGSTYVAALV